MNITIEDGDIDGGVIEDSGIVMYNGTLKTTNYGGFDNTNCYWRDADKRVIIIFKVGLQSLSGVTPISGYLGLDVNSVAGDPIDIESHEVLRTIEEYEVTWMRAKAGEDWTLEGAQGDGTDRVAAADYSDTISADNHTYQLPLSVGVLNNSLGGWLNLLIESTNMGLSPTMRIATSENTTLNKPYFYMEFTEVVHIYGVPRNKIVNFGGV